MLNKLHSHHYCLLFLLPFLSPRFILLSSKCIAVSLLILLLQQCSMRVGIDPSDGLLAKARARGADVAVAKGESLPFRDHSFDVRPLPALFSRLRVLCP